MNMIIIIVQYFISSCFVGTRGYVRGGERRRGTFGGGCGHGGTALWAGQLGHMTGARDDTRVPL